ncbi:prostate stem cell antigen-like [Erpetoichthys calabaricus]|uniref:prostate stem cell antigen-like n=1 Tax=Erpetoichthys calabaricus TaxID=27687 RepID=UPI00109F13F2|nr:prostate stem cell antigen-like [Erpetoichthys calabaricus]
MQTQLGVLLLLLVSAVKVNALQCYTCDAQGANSKCQSPAACSQTDTSCMTTVVNTIAGSLTLSTSITKACAATCSASELSMGMISTRVTCCATDLCNANSATIRRLQPLGLLVVLLHLLLFAS